MIRTNCSSVKSLFAKFNGRERDNDMSRLDRIVINGVLNSKDQTIWLSQQSKDEAVTSTKARTKLAHAIISGEERVETFGKEDAQFVVFTLSSVDDDCLLDTIALVLEGQDSLPPDNVALVTKRGEYDWRKQEPYLLVSTDRMTAHTCVMNLLKSNIEWLTSQTKEPQDV